MRRFLYILLSLSFIFSLFALTVLPSFAKVIDYTNYIKSISYDGDKQILTVNLPLTSTVWVLRYQSSTLDQTVTGSNATFPAVDLKEVVINPVSYYYIDISDVPVGATIEYGMVFHSEEDFAQRLTSITTSWVHNSSGENNPSDQFVSYSSATYKASGLYVLDVSDKLTLTASNRSDYLRFSTSLNFTPSSTDARQISAYLGFIRLTIPKSVYQSMVNGQDKNNKLVSEINDYLSKPSNAWIQKDLENQSNISDKKTTIDNFDSTISAAGSLDVASSDLDISGKVDYTQLNNFMAPIWSNNLILVMFTVTFAVVLCSYLLFGKKV